MFLVLFQKVQQNSDTKMRGNLEFQINLASIYLLKEDFILFVHVNYNIFHSCLGCD